jgi:predicted pyridoxine 5'-phosphate oxidase superfamily flavin-nucleotide-binding protein
MSRRFSEIAFTPSVQVQQTRRGSRAAYAAAEGKDDGAAADLMGMREFAFIDARDSFYLATVSETGWPYVQHRGGPPGFVRRLSERSIGWAEYIGNRQYVSAGNTAVDDRVSIIFVDYPHRERLKLLGHMHGYEVGERPDLAEALAVGRYRARVERFVVVTIEGLTGTARSISRRVSPWPRSRSWRRRCMNGSPSLRRSLVGTRIFSAE